ncbi:MULTISPECIES: helix-turn-helix domain-containing protein [Corynebacterium]|uniref:helix-turn-helix domain-containing protein n=1 Tax=Corynebacterium TaxID=1716 RepID=UPI00124E43A8|nr:MULTISPECIES: helix-turn-helix domain-containing protein [Corynebacterium]
MPARSFTNSGKQWITLAEAATYVDCSTKTIRRLIAAGDLEAAYLTARTLRVSVRSLQDLLEARSTTRWNEVG